MEDLKDKCYHFNTQKFIDNQEQEFRNKDIVSLLKEKGCNYCSGNDNECDNYLPNYEFYSNRGCLR